jgi:hypothetical protein
MNRAWIVLALLLASPSFASAAIVNAYVTMFSIANPHDDSVAGDYSAMVPSSGSRQSIFSDNQFSKVSYDVREEQGQMAFTGAVELSAVDEGLSDPFFTGSVFMTIEFDTDTPFSLSGSFAGAGDAEEHLLVGVYDDAGEVPFESYQEGSISAAPTLFAVNGLLLAGHTYQLGFDFWLTPADGQGVSTGAGNLRFAFGSATESAVPEPATCAIWSGLSLLGLLFRRQDAGKRELSPA